MILRTAILPSVAHDLSMFAGFLGQHLQANREVALRTVYFDFALE